MRSVNISRALCHHQGMTTAVIRRAAEADVGRIVALVNAAYRVEDFFKIGDRTDPADIRDHLRQGDFLLLEAGEELLGCVFVAVNGNEGYFGMLSVAPARQGQGLGTRLLKEAEDACARAGCRTMEIEVVSLRTELEGYYARVGYVANGTRPFPANERTTMACHFIVMKKNLDRAGV